MRRLTRCPSHAKVDRRHRHVIPFFFIPPARSIAKDYTKMCVIFKAISKTGALGSCVVSMHIGSNKRMTMQNLQISETAENRNVPKWLFPFHFPHKDRFISSRPDFVLVAPNAVKTQKQQTNVGGWVLRSGREQLKETGSTSAAPPATNRATSPKLNRLKDLSKHRRDIHLVKIKYCEDTRPQNQMNAAKGQHKDLCYSLQRASVTLHVILLGVGGTIYKTNTLKPLKELGLNSQRVKKLASKLHVHFVNFAAKLVHTRRALSSTVINFHQEPVSGQACNPLDPIDFSFLFTAEELYGTWYQSGSFSLINVGSGFHCLRSFFFCFFCV